MQTHHDKSTPSNNARRNMAKSHTNTRQTKTPLLNVHNGKKKNLFQAWGPTLSLDLYAFVPLIVLWSRFVFHFDAQIHVRSWGNLLMPWEHHDYVTEIVTRDGYSVFLFVFWTFQCLATCYIAHVHMVVKHHPKYYTSSMNKLVLMGHIIGGLGANLGSYLGFITGDTFLIKMATILGLCLHIPTSMWQARNVYGSREIMQPIYFAAIFMTFFKYLDVWCERGSPESVMEMGYAVNIFALVRIYHWIMLLLNMDVAPLYDRAVSFAGFTNFPICLGPTGCLQLMFAVLLWNLLLEAWMPERRELLQVVRSYHDVFQDKFNGRDVNFAKELRKAKKEFKEDNRQAVAKCVFNILTGEDRDYIEVEDLCELFDGWGLPFSFDLAQDLFEDIDPENTGRISFDQFKRELSFVWERVHDVGEAAMNAAGRKQSVYFPTEKRFDHLRKSSESFQHRRSTAAQMIRLPLPRSFTTTDGPPKRSSIFGNNYTREKRKSLWHRTRKSVAHPSPSPSSSANAVPSPLLEEKDQISTSSTSSDPPGIKIDQSRGGPGIDECTESRLAVPLSASDLDYRGIDVSADNLGSSSTTNLPQSSHEHPTESNPSRQNQEPNTRDSKPQPRRSHSVPTIIKGGLTREEFILKRWGKPVGKSGSDSSSSLPNDSDRTKSNKRKPSGVRFKMPLGKSKKKSTKQGS